jgi:hypothetical protein
MHLCGCWTLRFLCREDFDSIQDITKFKTSAGWGADPMKAVETKTKSAFTRSFNQAGLPVRTTIMVEDGKKSKRLRAATVAIEDGDEGFGGELADVRFLCLTNAGRLSLADLRLFAILQIVGDPYF